MNKMSSTKKEIIKKKMEEILELKHTRNEIKKNATERFKISLNQAEEKMYELEVQSLYII